MDLVSQNLLMTSGGKKDPTYMDDVFSTYLYKGNNAANTVNTGINYSEEGGLLWIKARDSARQHLLFDTVRGANKKISSNEDWTEYDGTGAYNQTFTTTGFTVNNSYTDLNDINVNYTSWNFRKQKGFFDIVTWSGNDATTRTLNHGLGSIPGCFMVKRLTGGSGDWVVYHRYLNNGVTPEQFRVSLNNTWTEANQGASLFGNTAPTSTQFTVGDWYNHSGSDYLCYLFAGGESTADDARSVELDGSGDWFTTSTSSDYAFGTGDFTIECWVNLTGSPSNQPHIADNRTDGSYSNQFTLYIDTDYKYKLYKNGNVLETIKAGVNTWNHIALVRSSGVTRLYLNGNSQGTYNDTNNYSTTSLVFGANAVNQNHNTNGRISNLRIVKGTAVYTSPFKPSTEPLKNITNTKLLCFNNSSTTGTTVGTITASGNPTAITDSPFDDPEGFQFGEEGDQNIIKCGSHSHSTTTNVRIYTGWEPQWVMTKNVSASSNWAMLDCIRGMPVGTDGPSLAADSNAAENGVIGTSDFVLPHGDGFTLKYGGTAINPGNGNKIIYIAIRRPDGYVGKPPEAGTNVFAMSVGSGSNPRYTSGFPVDMALEKQPAGNDNWKLSGRLTQGTYTYPDENFAQGSHYQWTYDWMTGWSEYTGISASYQSWMWKRNAGFDVLAYEGNGTAGHQIPHSLNKPPEMMWVKNRTDNSTNWMVMHSDATTSAGSGAKNYMYLNTNGTPQDSIHAWNDTDPTSTCITLGGSGEVNLNSKNYIALLFASVEGISKVGSYSGPGGVVTITTGFQPRFIMVKKTSGAGGWHVFDTVRGMGSGNDPLLYLNTSGAQITVDYVTPNSTGWSTTSGNLSQGDYIYYAHA